MGRKHDAWAAVPYRMRQAIKQELLARDGLWCCVCETPIASFKLATIEHKRERNAGGALLDRNNLGLAHPRCNYGRHGSANRTRVVDSRAFF